MTSRRLLPFLLAGLTVLAPVTATTTDLLTDTRKQFVAALDALKKDRIREYRRLADGLQHYPLYSYLEYHALLRRLKSATQQDVMAFIERYPDQPLADRLRRNWLYVLARQKQWHDFLATWQDGQPVRLQCYRLQARLHTGRLGGLEQDAIKLWLVGRSQDSACDPAFAWLERNDHLTSELRWQRIRLAMQNGQPSLAKYLARPLPAADREWVDTWRTARSRPATMLASKKLAANVPIAREIILYAIQRIARSNLDEARTHWQKIRPRYDFEPGQVADLERNMALRAAWRHHPSAHDWLTGLPDAAVDEEVREWRARSAIAAHNWEALLGHIRAMPEEERSREEWRFWHAHALQSLGKRLASSTELAILAKERDYHGFLAADELDWPYQMGNRPLAVNDCDITELATRDGFMRARELYHLDMMTDARREWRHATRSLSPDEVREAAALAHRWGWHDRAILTVARAKDFDDLVLRFPLEHREYVDRQAVDHALDPGHVFAVIRQESAFNKDARSHAGARGLMQLMPSTGRITARKYHIPLGGLQRLYDPERNIRIGTTYLNQVMEDYDRNVVLASAAYNAGPHRVRRWLPEDTSQDAREWVALVPFDETRGYIQRILSYAAIYDWRLEQPVRKLKSHMPDIYPQEHYLDNER